MSGKFFSRTLETYLHNNDMAAWAISEEVQGHVEPPVEFRFVYNTQFLMKEMVYLSIFIAEQSEKLLQTNKKSCDNNRTAFGVVILKSGE